MAITISGLDPTVLQSRTHELPAMKDGVTVKLTVAQILGLIAKGDFISLFNADDVVFTPAGTIAAATVQAAIAELDSETQSSFSARVGAVKTQVFAASGTYTPDSKMLFAIIECIGGGAGGGGAANASSNTFNGGGGGGSGGYSRKAVSKATVGASQTVTIGAAGAGATAGNNSGGSGGTTSVGSICIANGGTGGGGAADGAGGASGGGGTVSAAVGDILIPGSNGGIGRNHAATSIAFFAPAGAGGASHYGSPTQSTPPGNAANAAGGYGNGGSGGSSSSGNGAKAGGNGTAGLVIITEFCAP